VEGALQCFCRRPPRNLVTPLTDALYVSATHPDSDDAAAAAGIESAAAAATCSNLQTHAANMRSQSSNEETRELPGERDDARNNARRDAQIDRASIARLVRTAAHPSHSRPRCMAAVHCVVVLRATRHKTGHF